MNSVSRNDGIASSEASLLPQTFLERYGISPILFGFISLLVIFFLYQGIGGIITVVLFGAGISSDHVTGIRITTLIGQLLFILLPALFFTRLATHNVVSFLRIRFPQPTTLVIPLFGIFSLQQMLQIYMVYQEKIPIPPELQHVLDRLKHLIEQTYILLVGSSSIPELVFVLLVIAVVPAIAEELLFRGMIQRSFEQGLDPRRGLLLTGLIFAFYHLNPFSFIPLIALGIYLGFLVLRSESVIVSMAAHFYNNAFACVAVYVGKEDNYLITGEPEALSHIELLLTFIAFSLVFFLSTYYFIRVTQPSPSAT